MKVKSEILIVDDREENLHSLKKILMPLDVDIKEARSGNEALQLLLGSDFALVLIDVQMPGMDGFETVQIMRQDKSLERTPVIFLSAIYKEEMYVTKGIESGAVDFLIKPIVPEVLLGKVRIFLNLHESRKELEILNKALRTSEEEFRTLSENSVDFICRHNLKGEIIYANDVTLKALKMTAGEIYGKQTSELIAPPPEGENWDESVLKAARTGEIVKQVVEQTDNNKSQFLDWQLIPEFNNEGEVVTVLGIMRDISDAIQSEKLIREQSHLLNLIFLNSIDCLVLLDKDFNILKASHSFSTLLKTESAHLKEKNLFVYLPESLEMDLDQGRMNRTAVKMKSYVFPQDDVTVYRYWDLELVPIVDENDEIDLFFFSMKDVTTETISQHSFERELQINQMASELGRELNAPELSIKDMADRVFEVSKLLTGSEHGYVSEIDPETGDNVGHTLSAMMEHGCQIDGEDRKIAFPMSEDGTYHGMWGYVLNTGEPLLVNDYESSQLKTGLPQGHVPMKNFLTVPVKYGEEVIGQIAMTNSPFDYDDHHLEALLRIADLYAIAIIRRRDEEHKLAMEEEILQAEKMQVIGQLAGGMAHNFNNILNVILNAAQLSKSYFDRVDERVAKYTDIIISSSIRAAGITEKLLQYAKKEKKELNVFNVSKLIEDSILILNNTTDSKISISYESSGTLRKVKGDLTSIQNVLLNLGLNGSHAIEGQGHVKYYGENIDLDSDFCDEIPFDIVPGEYILIKVTDSGAGISQENLKKIFDPFFSTKQQGTGLGLSVSLRTIEDHKGALIVESREGEGTTFSIYLPATEEEEEIHDNGEGFKNGHGSILFVDDEEINRITGQDFLEILGYEVFLAENGKEALSVYREKKDSIDLIITDMQMPELDGLETIRQLRLLDENCKVILISGFSEEVHRDIIEKQGISGFIQKPYDHIKLSQAISKVLHS